MEYIPKEYPRAAIQYWTMRNRCSKKSHLRKDYLNNTLHPEWLEFNHYMDWAIKQIGFLKEELNGRLWCIDKDILFPRNKHYSPQTCVFVPQKINSFFSIDKSLSGNYLLGVSVRKDRKNKIFKDMVNNPNGERLRLGCFHTEVEAHNAYLEHKTLFAKELAIEFENIVDYRVIEKLNNFKYWLNSFLTQGANNAKT